MNIYTALLGKSSDLERIVSLSLLCLISGFLLNPLSWQHLTPAAMLVPLFAGAMLVMVSIVLSMYRPLLWIVLPPLYFTGALGAYFNYHFSVQIRYDAIGGLFDALTTEGGTLPTLGLVFWLAVSLVVSIIHIMLAKRLRFMDRRRMFICLMMSFAVAAGVRRGSWVFMRDAAYPQEIRELVNSRNVAPFSIFKIFLDRTGPLRPTGPSIDT